MRFFRKINTKLCEGAADTLARSSAPDRKVDEKMMMLILVFCIFVLVYLCVITIKERFETKNKKE
jgi:Na+/melibiose symporter-like transporter